MKVVMKKTILLLVILTLFIFKGELTNAQSNTDSILPLRGLCIAAPSPRGVDSFSTFIATELAPRNVNTLILRVDFKYQFVSHPELRDSIALSYEDIKKLVTVCRQHHIRLIPQINLLGHQSWASKTTNLLKVYPQFDETPQVIMPEKYAWPNADGLYCKSYCPLHPQVHAIVFDLVNEICDAFEATAFHAGMDEVFYLADDNCIRCKGRDKATLFAAEVKTIRDELALKNRELWIWGDRLLDGKTTGYGMWEASFNDTHPAIDLIPKDVMICDWHYERADKSAVYFAMKGLRVATCTWRRPEIAVSQVIDMMNFRKDATTMMKDRFQGMIQTVWSGAGNFLRECEEAKAGNVTTGYSQWNCFEKMFEKINETGSTIMNK